MGLFNVVRGEVTCPRCGRRAEAAVEVRLGYVHEGQTLRVDEPYPWNHPAMPAGRPPDGNAVGDGYAECPACGRDFFVRVVVENNIVRRLEPDPDRPGYVPDGGYFPNSPSTTQQQSACGPEPRQ